MASMSFGHIYLRKPGRMRVEYDPPVPILLVADGGLLSYFDQEARRTQADAAEAIDGLVPRALSHQAGRRHHRLRDHRQPRRLQISLYQTDEPDAGTVSLIFVDNPLHLTQWTVTDRQNKEVRVGLLDVQVGINVPNNKFGTPRACRQTDDCAGGNRGGGGGKNR